MYPVSQSRDRNSDLHPGSLTVGLRLLTAQNASCRIRIRNPQWSEQASDLLLEKNEGSLERVSSLAPLKSSVTEGCPTVWQSRYAQPCDTGCWPTHSEPPAPLPTFWRALDTVATVIKTCQTWKERSPRCVDLHTGVLALVWSRRGGPRTLCFRGHGPYWTSTLTHLQAGRMD